MASTTDENRYDDSAYDAYDGYEDHGHGEPPSSSNYNTPSFRHGGGGWRHERVDSYRGSDPGAEAYQQPPTSTY
eukprot:CAMPEP_0170506960 /NCGR_PEP_ID=MMETSP0208-20121228/57049_1 /TAXON_ID=197538 /ORGANISM="Strombidium inclinatum, Strain S3" /LENGTH=73 /DNA_ID=CAMNT_0010788851 /DNA_START=217 /DNA_END=438 /DNA_ORIENTATION=+